MNKKLSVIVIVVLLNINVLIADTPCGDCVTIVKHFDLDVTIKNTSGWKRVCNNGKIKLYTSKKLVGSDLTDLCECITKEQFRSRAIESTRVIK